MYLVGILGKEVLYQVDNINYGSVLAIGRARNIFATDGHPMPAPRDFCASVLPVLFPDGDLYACCGERRYANHMYLGNLSRESFSEILQRMRRNPIIPLVAFIGFDKTLQWLRQKGIEPDGVAELPTYDSCLRCHRIMTDRRVVRCLRESIPPEFAEIIELKQLLVYGYRFFGSE